MSLNIWAIRFTGDFPTNILKSIDDDPELIISLTTHREEDKDEHKKIVLKYSGVSYSHQKIFAAKTKFHKKKYFYENIHLTDEVDANYSYFAIQNFERFQRYQGDLFFEEKNYLLHLQLQFWKRNFEKYKPDAVLFFDMPHMYYEILLLGYLRKNDIPSYIIQNSPGKKGFYFQDADFNPIAHKDGIKMSIFYEDRIALARKSETTKLDKKLNSRFNFIKFTLLGLKFLIISIIFKFLFSRTKYKIGGYFIKNNFMDFKQNYLHNEYFYKFLYMLRCISSFLSYSAKSKEIGLSKSFSYLALTSSWEPTFQPLVSPLNWHLIIERCLTKISKNEILYIKEHPSQFSIRHHQPFSRHSSFYKSILNIDPRIRFAPLNYNSIDLIKSANIVFCSSRSSTFIEAYGLNKDIVTFGRNLINGNNKEIILNRKNEIKKEKNFFYNSPFFYGNISEAKETGIIISKIIKSFLKEKLTKS